MLIDEFNSYFLEYTKKAQLDQKLIRNCFGTDACELTKGIHEELIESQNDNNCKDAFE